MSKLEDREVFEIYAVKYAHNANRTRNGNMLYMDEHDVPMPLDYFVWVIKNDMRTYVVDTGFGAVASKKRATPLLRTPAEGLALMDVDAAKVDNVIISHMHYDHAGGIIGGHSAGLMCVRVWTQRGWVVVASDCAHFYENIRDRNPFVIVYNLGDMMNGYTTMEMLADSPDHIIPGHDPLVMEYYPAASKELEGIVARLDLAPKEI